MSTRFSRSQTQRILCVGENINIEDAEGHFRILGSTNKEYTVVISTSSFTCSCPDHQERLMCCKHILFTLTKVLDIGVDNVRRFEKYETFEIPYKEHDLLRLALIARTTRDDRTIIPLSEMKSAIPQSSEPVAEPTVLRKSLTVGDTCPICYEEMDSDKEKVAFCKLVCGNNVHEVCMKRYIQHTKKQECVLCRGKWAV